MPSRRRSDLLASGRRRAAVLALAAAGVAASACGGDEAAPTLAFAMPADPAAPLKVAEHPFPSDVFRDEAGELIVPVDALPFDSAADPDAVAAMARTFEARDCFGPTAGVTFPIAGLGSDEAIDAASLEGRVELIELASGAALPVETHVRRYEQQLYVRAARGNILLPGATYGVVIRRGVATTDGRELGRPADLGAALDADGAPRLSRAVRGLAPLAAHLGDTAADVVGATAFTVCDADGELEAARAIVWSGAPPTLVVDRVWAAGPELDALLGTPEAQLPGTDNPGGIAHATIGHVVTGWFRSPNFQSAVPGQLGAWEIADGAPVIKGHDDVPVLIVLPAGVDSYADLPVVVFQHGINASRTVAFDVANTFTSRGYAVMSIDIPYHGDRFPDAVDEKHGKSDTEGPDGFADTTGFGAALLLFDIDPNGDVVAFDPTVMADSLRQCAVDLMTLARFAVEGDLSAIGEAVPALDALSFDGERLTYGAESFGSILGLLALAFEPAYRAAFLGVGGGSILSDFLENSPLYSLAFLPLIGSAFDVESNQIDPSQDPAHTHQAHALLGMLVDRGDPISYARRVVANGIHVVMALARDDESVPNQASEAQAAAMGLEWVAVDGGVAAPRFVDPAILPVTPAVDGVVAGNVEVDGAPVTAAVYMLEPATHGMMTHRKGESMFEPGFPPFVNRLPRLEIENPIDRIHGMMIRFVDARELGDTLP